VLARVYQPVRRTVSVAGVKITDAEGRMKPVLRLSVEGREVVARGRRPSDREFGVLELTGAEVVSLKAHGYKVVGA